jgi:hypothetical protein
MYGDALEPLADRIKDALLDWELLAGPGELPDSLLPMSPADFVAGMRVRTEEVLGHLAEVINAMPASQFNTIGEARVAELIAALVREAIERGVQLRLEATQAERPLPEPPQGAWASRYRRMQESDGPPS